MSVSPKRSLRKKKQAASKYKSFKSKRFLDTGAPATVGFRIFYLLNKAKII